MKVLIAIFVFLFLIFVSVYYEENTINSYAVYFHFMVTWILITLITLNYRDFFSPPWLLFSFLFVYFFLKQGFNLLLNYSGLMFNDIGYEISELLYLEVDVYLITIVLSFSAGYSLLNRSAKSVACSIPVFDDDWNRFKTNILVSVISGIALISAVYLVLNMEKSGIQAGVVAEINEGGFFMKLAWVIINVYFVVSMFYLMRNGIDKLWLMHLLIGLLIIIIIGRRSPIVWLVIPALIYRHYYVKKISKIWLMIFGSMMVGLLLVFAYIRVLSYASGEDGTLEMLYGFSDMFVWDSLAFILSDYFSTNDLRYGIDFIPKVFQPIFSTGIYQEFSIGKEFSELYVSEFRGGVPPSFPGVLYMNFGLIGVITGMFFLGYLARIIYQYMILNDGNKATLIIYSAFLIIFFFLLRLGDIWLIFSNYSRILFLILILLFILSNFKMHKNAKS